MGIQILFIIPVHFNILRFFLHLRSGLITEQEKRLSLLTGVFLTPIDQALAPCRFFPAVGCRAVSGLVPRALFMAERL